MNSYSVDLKCAPSYNRETRSPGRRIAVQMSESEQEATSQVVQAFFRGKLRAGLGQDPTFIRSPSADFRF